MFRYWKFLLLIILSAAVLTGCGKSLKEEAAAGIDQAKSAFELNDKQTNIEVEGVQLYKPAGFTVEEEADAQNIVLNKGSDTFILFINPNEGKESRLFYDLLKDKSSDKIVSEKVFSNEGVFGFAAVVKKDGDKAELIASVGGVKMTTITKKKNIAKYMAWMMEIVRSIEQEA